MAAHASAVHADDQLYLCSIILEWQFMPVQCMQMTCYINVASSWNVSSCQCSICRWPVISMEHLPGTAVHANAVHTDDLLYLCSIFLERQLMPMQCMQMTLYIYVASSWNGSSCQCSACRWPVIFMQHLPGMAAHASAVHADDLLYLCSIFLEPKLMPVQYMQMTCYIYVASFWYGSPCQCSACRWPVISMYHLPGTAAHASAVHADDLLYLYSIFLERQLMPVQYMQMICYIYVASSWNGLSCQCSACRWPFISM
jgi:hypothetical protein